jgi:hypothetical protein
MAKTSREPMDTMVAIVVFEHDRVSGRRARDDLRQAGSWRQLSLRRQVSGTQHDDDNGGVPRTPHHARAGRQRVDDHCGYFPPFLRPG